MKINKKNNNIIIILISLWCAIEFIISPYPYYGKENGVFPTIPIGPLSFDLSEILIYFFISFSLMLLFNKLLYRPKISLGYRYHKYLVLAFITVLLASIVLGFVFRGSVFMVMIRVQVILLLFLVLMNLYDIKSIVSTMIKIVYWTGILNIFIYIFSMLGIPLWKITIYPDLFTYLAYMWFGMYLSIFSYAILLNKVLVNKKVSIVDYIFIILIIVVVIINITFKPIVLSIFLVTFTTFLFFYKNNIKRIKISIISIFLLLSPFFIYQAMNDDQKTLLIYTFSQRFLKVPAYDISELVENVSNIHVGGSRDFSAGRFDIWSMYFTGVANTPIVSDNYGHKVDIHTDSLNHEGIAAHNSIVHYTYYAGYIAGISLLLIILYFIRTTFKYKNRLMYFNIAKQYNIKEYEFHGILAFIYAIIGNELVGGPLSNAKFSWFWWLLVVFVLKVISESRMERLNVKQ